MTLACLLRLQKVRAQCARRIDRMLTRNMDLLCRPIHDPLLQTLQMTHHIIRARSRKNGHPPKRAQSTMVCTCIAWCCFSSCTASVPRSARRRFQQDRHVTSVQSHSKTESSPTAPVFLQAPSHTKRKNNTDQYSTRPNNIHWRCSHSTSKDLGLGL